MDAFLKKGKKWYKADLDEKTLALEGGKRAVKAGFKAVTDDFITLNAFIRQTKNGWDELTVLKKFKADRLYVKPQAEKKVRKAPSAPVATEGDYWKKFHKYCTECVHGCKQSWRVLSLTCPQHQAA